MEQNTKLSGQGREMSRHNGPKRADLTERLERHRAFWSRGRIDRPLVHVWLGDNFLSDAMGYKLREGLLLPENDGFDGAVDLWGANLEHYESIGDDAFHVPVPFYLMTWMEAILGCEIEGKSGTAWPHHLTGMLEVIERDLSPDLATNAWMNRLLQISRRAGELAGGSYPVGTPFLRGPMDTMAGVLGGQRMCSELYDNPARVRSMADRLADIWIEVAKTYLTAISPFHGGFLSGVKGVWAPGPSIMASVDYAIMVSPTHFRQLFLPSYRKLFDAIDYAFLHTHSAAVPALADDILGIDSLKAVEVTIDPTGPELPTLIPTLRKIQERKPLMLFSLSNAQFALARQSLTPRGLLLSPSVSSIDEARPLTEM